MAHLDTTAEHLALLIATLDSLGSDVAIPDATRRAAEDRALLMWQQDGLTWLRSVPRPGGEA